MTKHNKTFVYIDSENVPLIHILGSVLDRLSQDKDLNLISVKVFEKYHNELHRECKDMTKKKCEVYDKRHMMNELYLKHTIEPIVSLETHSGKNSIDMKMVKIIRDDIKNCIFDIVVLMTNDRDFLEVSHTCKQQGKSLWVLGDAGNVSRSLKDYCDEFIDYNDPYNKKVENDAVGGTKVAKNPRSRLNECIDKYMEAHKLSEVRICRLREDADIFEHELDYKLLGYPKFRIMVENLLNKKRFSLDVMNSSDWWIKKIV